MHLDRLRQVVNGLPEVERVIVMEYVQCGSEMDLSGFKVSYTHSYLSNLYTYIYNICLRLFG